MSWLSWLTGILSGNGSETENMDMDDYSADDGGMQYWQELGMYEFLTDGDGDVDDGTETEVD
jgi:hypothetical protein